MDWASTPKTRAPTITAIQPHNPSVKASSILPTSFHATSRWTSTFDDAKRLVGRVVPMGPTPGDERQGTSVVGDQQRRARGYAAASSACRSMDISQVEPPRQ